MFRAAMGLFLVHFLGYSLEKSGGIIRAGNDEAAKFSEQKGAKMP